MNKKKGIGILLVLAAVVILITVIIAESNKSKYQGSGIPSLKYGEKDCFLDICYGPKTEPYSEKLGKKSKVFWSTSSISDEKTVLATNEDDIFVLEEKKIKKYKDVVANIMDVFWNNNSFFTISQYSGMWKIIKWSEDFSEKRSELELCGEYSDYNIIQNNLFAAAMDEKAKTTALYSINLNTFQNKKEAELNFCAEAYCFSYQEKLYLCVNQQIMDSSTKDIYKLYTVFDQKVKFIMDMPDFLNKAVKYNGNLYALFGTNSYRLCILQPEDNKLTEIDTGDKEGIGLFEWKNNLFYLSDSAIYYLDGEKVRLYGNIDDMPENNY